MNEPSRTRARRISTERTNAISRAGRERLIALSAASRQGGLKTRSTYQEDCSHLNFTACSSSHCRRRGNGARVARSSRCPCPSKPPFGRVRPSIPWREPWNGSGRQNLPSTARGDLPIRGRRQGIPPTPDVERSMSCNTPCRRWPNPLRLVLGPGSVPRPASGQAARSRRAFNSLCTAPIEAWPDPAESTATTTRCCQHTSRGREALPFGIGSLPRHSKSRRAPSHVSIPGRRTGSRHALPDPKVLSLGRRRRRTA